METFERDFKGIWVPKEVWLDKRLTMVEKGILMEIDSLDKSGNRCFAGNDHFVELCQCSERTVSTAISKLIKLGYVELIHFDGRTRQLGSMLRGRVEKSCEAESQNLRGDINNKYIYKDYSLENHIDSKESNNINVITKEKVAEEPKKKKDFVKPTLEEVQAYIKEQRFIVNAETFIDYYESNGWKVGKNPMKDWKAAVRTWEQKEKEKRNRYGNQSNSKPYVREEQEFGVGNGEELPF